MLADLWPTYAVQIHTARLTLRLPDEDELTALPQVAATGIRLASWTPASWTLGLGVFLSGDRPIGREETKSSCPFGSG